MDDEERYFKAAHAMQSGVAFEMNYLDTASATEPKHLRVGVNVALSDGAALVRLLIAKGILTEEEYFKAIADMMEEEVAKYQERANARFGRPDVIKFG